MCINNIRPLRLLIQGADEEAMFDDPKPRSTYECFECGTLVTQESVPGACPNCGSEFRNRSMALE